MRRTTSILIKTAALTAILLGGYYLAVIRPQAETSAAMRQVEYTISARRASLLQNQLAWMEFTQLDATNPNFDYTRGTLLTTIQQTNAQSLELLEDAQELSALPGDTEKLSAEVTKLASDHRTLLEKQQPFIEELFAFEEAAANIYQYDTAIDIGNLDPASDTELISTRAVAASSGIRNTVEKISELPLTHISTTEIERSAAAAERAAQQLAAVAEAGLSQNTSDAAETFEQRFAELVEATYNAQHTALSASSSTILSEQTNILNRYTSTLEHIQSLYR